VLIAPNTPRFALLQQQGVCAHALLTEPIIFREQGSGTQKLINQYLCSRDIDAKQQNVVAHVADPEALKKLVILGAGVSIISQLCVKDELDSGRLLAFELDSEPVYRDIYMVHRRNGIVTKLAQDFAAFAKKQIK